jgi:ubiquinone/menaquinone biosynthesis C-methylase UbiE
MMAKANHDERAGQLFTRDLKSYIAGHLNPPTRALAQAFEAERGPEARTFEEVEAIFDGLLDHEAFRNWISLKRMAQEMMWEAVIPTVDRQIDGLTELGRIAQPLGSLTLDPDFTPPAYISHMDTHLMPGGYTVDEGEGSLRQGALMDAGGAVYQMGKALGPRNDRAGQSAITHVMQLYPDLKPKRILDLGTGIGRAAVCAATLFPDAEVYGIDVGPSVLRYAHARAEHLGARVHFSQQNAENTNFEDGFFDLIVSTAIFHETSEPSIQKILAEAYRLLAPGGVNVNIEVSYRYWEGDIFHRLDVEWETHFNNESSFRAAVAADYGALFDAIGYEDRHLGWQKVGAEPGQPGFALDNPKPVYALYAASARKPVRAAVAAAA